MSEQPPEGPDRPRLADAVADAVRQAMRQAGLSGDELADAVEQALDGLDELEVADVSVRVIRSGDDPPPATSSPDASSPDASSPDIHLVDGGLSRDAPRTQGPRPPLHIAGDAPPAERPEPAGLSAEGRIRLDAEERQAVFRGAVVRAYRIACDLGRLAVSVDGVVVEALGPGQSVDVEGGSISVRAADDGARGRYARL